MRLKDSGIYKLATLMPMDTKIPQKSTENVNIYYDRQHFNLVINKNKSCTNLMRRTFDYSIVHIKNV